MHQLFVEVLSKKDLSRAGELFAIDDRAIVGDLSELLEHIQAIANSPTYSERHNDQSVVEICLTRIISVIRDSNSIEKHAEALVSLLESCLHHNLKPTARDQDAPHAKIASDVVSCIFLNHSKKSVMALAVPVAVKLLHRGNKELSRNLSSYLSLATINNADILAPHIQPIIDSIISGNYSLVRVLPSIYVHNNNKRAIHDHIMALVNTLPSCDTSEKSSLLKLFAQISKVAPEILEDNLPQLADCLAHSQTVYITVQIFLDIATNNAKPFVDHVHRVIKACELQTGMVSLVAEFLGLVGRLDVAKGEVCCRFLTVQLSKSDLGTTITILKQIKSIVEAFPSLLPTFLPSIIAQTENSTSSTVQTYLQQLRALHSSHSPAREQSTGVLNKSSSHLLNSLRGNTFLGTVGGAEFVSQQAKVAALAAASTRLSGNGFHILHRSIPRLHVGSNNGQNSNVHRSLTALVASGNNPVSATLATTPSTTTSRHAMNRMSVESMSTPTRSSSQKSASSSYLLALQQEKENASHNVINAPNSYNMHNSNTTTVHIYKPSTIMSSKSAGTAKSFVASSIDSQLQQHTHNISSSSSSSHYNLRSETISTSHGGSRRGEKSSNCLSGSNTASAGVGGIINANGSNGNGLDTSSLAIDSLKGTVAAENRISVFEPYPMRDAVQHFCEKHIDKIKTYMQNVFVKIPLPVKCTIEERKAKKMVKIYFACQAKSENCLYSKTYFVMKTKNARIWIHLMFLALQARAKSALCTREPSVNSLKNCWDTLKLDNRTFLTLVTSAFPSAKDQETLIEELRSFRYFDVFMFNAIHGLWGCFLCNHPDKANGFLLEDEPVIEGQLKEKKGKWTLFKRWRTRYFTLSGVHLYRDESADKVGQPVEIGKVQSVRALGNSRGRTIPKAFEIFTNEKTYVLKGKNCHNNQEWLQCLSIAMAHSQAKET